MTRRTQNHDLETMALMNRKIVQVDVKQLFGRYDYCLPMPGNDKSDAPSVSLLYGDNGTGKTTILALIFHLVSSANQRGHKTFVARTPFQRFTIVFSDGGRLEVKRPNGELNGDYEIALHIPGELDESIAVRTDPGSGVVTSESISEEFDEFMEKTKTLFPDVFYLKDSRDLISDSIAKIDEIPDDLVITSSIHRRLFMRSSGSEGAQLEGTLMEAIARTREWLKDESIDATSSGEIRRSRDI